MGEFQSPKRNKAEALPEPSATDLTSPKEQRRCAIERCSEVLALWRGSPPFGLELVPALAAAKWLDWFLEGPNYPSERPQKASFGGLIDPYETRVTRCLAKYLQLAHDDQRYIHQAAVDGIRWRGEDLDFFRLVGAEKMGYRQLSELEAAKYRESVMQKAAELNAKLAQARC